jgi:hypothetical protein
MKKFSDTDFAIVKIQEEWDLSDIPEVEKVVTSYLVDLNRLVYQCDIRPSCDFTWLVFDQRYKNYMEVDNLRLDEIDEIIAKEPGYNISLYRNEIEVGKHNIIEIIKLDAEELKNEFTEYDNLDDDKEYEALCDEIYDLISYWGLYW